MNVEMVEKESEVRLGQRAQFLSAAAPAYRQDISTGRPNHAARSHGRPASLLRPLAKTLSDTVRYGSRKPPCGQHRQKMSPLTTTNP